MAVVWVGEEDARMLSGSVVSSDPCLRESVSHSFLVSGVTLLGSLQQEFPATPSRHRWARDGPSVIEISAFPFN